MTRAAFFRGFNLLRLALLSLCTAPALAAPQGVSTGDCEVLASGQLRSAEYVASYRGACQGGKAQGQDDRHRHQVEAMQRFEAIPADEKPNF